MKKDYSFSNKRMTQKSPSCDYLILSMNPATVMFVS